MKGTLGGGLTLGQVQTVLLPGLQRMLNEHIAHCAPDPAGSCGCANDGLAADILRELDRDATCSLSLEEIGTHSLLRPILVPDLDLFDEHGAFAPGRDGVNDAVSFGVGFSAVRASVPSRE